MTGDGRTRYYGRGPEAFQERMESQPQKKGLFGGNRSLLIIFIDVMIILVIYAIYVFFLSGPTTSRTIDGYRFALSASSGETSAVVTLRISAAADAAADDPIVTVRFGQGAEIKDVLPQPGGEERVFQREITIDETAEVAEVVVEALGRSFTLGAPLDD